MCYFLQRHITKQSGDKSHGKRVKMLRLNLGLWTWHNSLHGWGVIFKLRNCFCGSFADISGT